MTVISRRGFLRNTALLLAASSGCTVLRQRSAQTQVLDGLARGVSVPDTQAIVTRSESLSAALRAYQSAPSEPTLQAARTAHRAALLAWQRAYAFRNGPVIESNAYLRSTFWPIRPGAVAEVLEGTGPVEATQIDELGVDVKGMFALEHLLYEGPQPDGTAWLALAQPRRMRAQALAVAYADDALAHANRAARSLGSGDDFAQRFTHAGQESINLLVNQMIATVETAAARRLDQVLATHDNGTLRTKDVQGAPSGLSTEIPRVWLRSTQLLYAGTGADGQGLSTLVRAAAPAIDASLRAAFQRARDAFEQLTAPLERVAAEDRQSLASAVRMSKELETALRVELVSALQVTLTFVPSDGD